jgi:TolB-like protein/Flp pilus assembly protein TadD
MSGGKRRLAGILAADVVGYSAMIAADEPVSLARVRALRKEVVEPIATSHDGRLFKTMGDGFLLEFASAVQALQCAIAIQTTLNARTDGLHLRIGVHQGEVVPEGDDLVGDGVIIAARLEPLAEHGGIVISSRVKEDASGKMTLEVDDLGEPPLKNIAAKIRAFRVRLHGPVERPVLALPDKPSLVVLPFQNMSGDPEQEYFADGMVGDITTALSRIRAFFVIARNSAFAYKGKSPDVRQVGRELGVRYVLEGSVRKSGNRVRITGQLIDATTGAHIWADRFDGDLTDVFDLQDRVTASVAGAIEPQLQRAEIERAQRKATQDLGAYDYFLRGMAIFHLGDAERMVEAQALFAKAFTLDPGYGAAYGMAATCINFRRSVDLLTSSAPEIAEAVALARLAATNGRDDPTALALAGRSLAYLGRDLDAGALLIERACNLNPNSALAWTRAGIVRSFLGDHATATANLERAIRLSPVDPELYQTLAGMAMSYSMQGKYDDAVACAERGVGERPNWVSGLRILATVYAMSGRVDDARRTMADFVRVCPQVRLSNAQDWMPFRRAEDLERQVVACRLAGMPE